jgi:hypothetical protein
VSENDLLIYGLFFFGGLFIAVFEVYRNNNEIWKLKRYTDMKLAEERGQMYLVACNTFVQNCRYMFDAGVLKMPDEWNGSQDELILQNFFTLFPDAKKYLVPKEQGYDVRLDDSDTLSQGRSQD